MDGEEKGNLAISNCDEKPALVGGRWFFYLLRHTTWFVWAIIHFLGKKKSMKKLAVSRCR